MQLPPDALADVRRFAEGVLECTDVDEIILYGSASTGEWDPVASDIDVAVIATGDCYSARHRTSDSRVNNYWSEPYVGRQGTLLAHAEKRMKTYAGRMHAYLCVASDLENRRPVNDGRGSLGDAIQQGKRLYTRQEGFLI